jgi:hypothetical protein
MKLTRQRRSIIDVFFDGGGEHLDRSQS